MKRFEIIQDFYQPVSHNVKRDIFGGMMPNLSTGELIVEDGEYIKINKRPFGKPVALKLLGSSKKVDAMFKTFSWFGGISFYKFFTFEFMCMLEEVKMRKMRYDVDIEVIDQCLEYFRGNINQLVEVHDIDRKRLDKLFNVTPLKHQEEIIQKYIQYKYIQKYRGMLMHASAGSGKTLSSLFITEGLGKEIEKCVILCPLPTVKDVWVKTLNADVVGYKEPQSFWLINSSKPYNGEKYIICHYEGLEKLHNMLNKLPKEATSMIIDECHNLNDPKSKRSKLAIELANKLNMQNVLLLSGTPLKTGFKELSLLFKFLDSNFNRHVEQRYLTLYSSATDFLTEVLRERYDGYAVKVEKSAIKLDPLTTVNLKINVPEEKMEKYYLANIKEDLKAYVERRDKELKKEMGYWTEQYLTLREKARQASGVNGFSYNDYVRDVDTIKKANGFQYGQIADILERANKFEKEVLLPALSSEDKKIFKDAKTIYKYPELKIQGEALANVIGRARINCHIMLAEHTNLDAIIKGSKKKTIIFSNYVDVCKATEQICVNLGYNPICVFGEETKNLAANVNKFLNSKNINPLITTYKSLSTGVPLTAADNIICLDMPFRMHTYEQAVARAWRLGQDSPVTTYIVEANTTVPNINSRNLDIISWYKEEVERITGVESSVGLKGSAIETGESISVEEFNISTEDIDLGAEGWFSSKPKTIYMSDRILPFIDNSNSILDQEENEFKIVDYYDCVFNPEDHEDLGIMGHVRISDKSKTLQDYINNCKKSIDFNIKRIKEIEKSLGNKKYQIGEYSLGEDLNKINRTFDLNEIDPFFAVIDKIDQVFSDTPEDKINGGIKEIRSYLENLFKEYNRVGDKLKECVIKEVKKEDYKLSMEELNISIEAINPKRQAVQDFIIKYIGKLVTGNQNTDLYKNLFSKMSDKEFDDFMIKLRDGKINLSVIIPNGMKEIKSDLQNNLKVAKELGYDFYQRLKITGSKSTPDYITPNKYLVVKLPVKRASQLLSKKISIPQDNRSRDLLTGQVTGKSKAAKLTNPEVQILLGLGLDSSIKELMKYRGGDLGAGNALNNAMMRYGQATQDMASQYSTGVVSTKTLKQFFQAMHIRSTL